MLGGCEVVMTANDIVITDRVNSGAIRCRPYHHTVVYRQYILQPTPTKHSNS